MLGRMRRLRPRGFFARFTFKRSTSHFQRLHRGHARIWNSCKLSSVFEAREKFARIRGDEMQRFMITAGLLCALAGAAFAQSTAAPPAQEAAKPAAAAPVKNDYSKDENWL